MLFPKLILACILTAAITCIFSENVECRSTQFPIRSDVIVTKWPQDGQSVPEKKEPGWMRKQLMKFGEVASRVGNAMGTNATKIASAIDKICEVIKTIIPVMAAVCHVGQFKFCAAASEGPNDLALAMSPSASLNLDDLDKRK